MSVRKKHSFYLFEDQKIPSGFLNSLSAIVTSHQQKAHEEIAKMIVRYPIAATLLTLALTASAQEKKIERSTLPPAVEKAVQAETKGATIKGFAEEREHGKTFYEVETVVDGHTRDILFNTDGTIAEIEEEVALESLPANVQAGLKKKAGGVSIDKVESLTKKDKLVAYEGSIRRNGKAAEIQVGPEGKSLSHEE